MSHNQDKQCLDDSIVVDTSNGRSRGSVVVVATARTMSVARTQVSLCYGEVRCT
jgi:hypothetical protein